MPPRRELTPIHWLAMLAATATACQGSLPQGACVGGACGSQTTITRRVQQSVNRKLDIVFVIDDTDAVAPWQDNLRAGYPAMARALENVEPSMPNLHVGFVRASGCAPQTRAADCGIAAPESFIRHEWCASISNFSGDLAQTFGCLADFGTGACAPAQPFQALRDVLAQPPPPGWQGFLRPDAYLMIVVVAGRDDASDASVADLVAFVRGMKQDPASQIMVSVIGPGGDCTAESPPPRLTELVQSFGANGVITGLCDHPTAVIGHLLRPIQGVIQPACISGVLDVDPSAPGLQADCTFEDTVTGRDGARVTTALPACDAAEPPCWRLTDWAEQSCALLEIDRGASFCIESATQTLVECLVAGR